VNIASIAATSPATWGCGEGGVLLRDDGACCFEVERCWCCGRLVLIAGAVMAIAGCHERQRQDGAREPRDLDHHFDSPADAMKCLTLLQMALGARTDQRSLLRA
jgi:hypothetical protein